jgi:hypothetical protein
MRTDMITFGVVEPVSSIGAGVQAMIIVRGTSMKHLGSVRHVFMCISIQLLPAMLPITTA